MTIGTRSIVLLTSFLSYGLNLFAAGPTEVGYLSRVREITRQARQNIPTLTQSSECAAKAFLSGARIWAAGRQEDFISEVCGRAGGLMSIAPLGKSKPDKADIVLYAATGQLTQEDLKLISEWRKNGVVVITFDSSAGPYKDRFPVDTVANVIDLWTWTGEFVASCTRLKKMPVLYKSYGLPGGLERGKKYRGKKFHDDLRVNPIAPGALGKAYLDKIESILSQIIKTQMINIRKSAKWWREVPDASATCMVMGHMFPLHFQDSRAQAFSYFTAVSDNASLIDEANHPKFILFVGYQKAPHILIKQAEKLVVNLVYFGVEPAPTSVVVPNILYINPFWPLSDACVSIPGYDIPILPASGVIQASIYWAIAAERQRQ